MLKVDCSLSKLLSLINLLFEKSFCQLSLHGITENDLLPDPIWIKNEL